MTITLKFSGDLSFVVDTMAASSNYDPNTKKCSCKIGTMCRHLDRLKLPEDRAKRKLEWRPDDSRRTHVRVDQVLECRGTAKDDSLTIGETLILLNMRIRDVECAPEEIQLENAVIREQNADLLDP